MEAMKNFNGTPEEFWAERKRLCKEHNINMIRAGCYLSNYYDDFLCKDCNVERCGEIAGKESGEDLGSVPDSEGTDESEG